MMEAETPNSPCYGRRCCLSTHLKETCSIYQTITLLKMYPPPPLSLTGSSKKFADSSFVELPLA